MSIVLSRSSFSFDAFVLWKFNLFSLKSHDFVKIQTNRLDALPSNKKSCINILFVWQRHHLDNETFVVQKMSWFKKRWSNFSLWSKVDSIINSDQSGGKKNPKFCGREYYFSKFENLSRDTILVFKTNKRKYNEFYVLKFFFVK